MASASTNLTWYPNLNLLFSLVSLLLGHQALRVGVICHETLRTADSGRNYDNEEK